MSSPLRIRRQRIASTLAALAFICQFPGFYVYHLLVVSGMPAFLDGYTVRLSAFLLPVLLIAYLIDLPRVRSGLQADLLFIAFCSYILFLAWVGYSKNSVASIDYIGAILVWLSFYFTVRTIVISKRWAKYVYAPSLMLIILIVSMNTSAGVFELGVNNQLATYQSFALVLMAVTLLLMASIRSRRINATLWIVSLPLLFVLGARSEVAAMILCGSIYVMLAKAQRTSVIISGAFCVLMVWSNLDFFAAYSDNRVMRLITSGVDANLSERHYAMEYAIAAIYNQPILGDFGNYPNGLFAHNALAAWADFGILGFLFFLLLLGISFARSIQSFANGNHGSLSLVAISATVAVVTLLVLAKTFVYFLVPVMLAMNVKQVSRASTRCH